MNATQLLLEPEYAEVDDNGEEIVQVRGKKKLKKDVEAGVNKANLPKTDLQRAALSTVGRQEKGFVTREMRKQFIGLEAKCAGADDYSYVVKKWYENCIDVWRKANTPIVQRPLSGLISYMGNEGKRDEWILKNKKRIIENRKKEELEKVKITVQVRDKNEEVIDEQF